MPRRRYNDDDTRGAAHTAAAVLRALGHGCLIAAGGMGIAAICGLTTPLDIGGAAIAGMVGMGTLMAADAVRDTAILANTERRHQREDEQDRDNDRVDAMMRQMAAEAGVQPDPASGHAARLARERHEREASSGRMA
jgi:hypothetical protein